MKAFKKTPKCWQKIINLGSEILYTKDTVFRIFFLTLLITFFGEKLLLQPNTLEHTHMNLIKIPERQNNIHKQVF